MDISDKALTKIFGSSLSFRELPVNKCELEAAIACLALFIETGREYCEKEYKSAGYDFEVEVLKFIHRARAENIQENKTIVESLLFAFIKDAKSAKYDDGAAHQLFLKRLSQIFKPPLAKLLYEKGLSTLRECRASRCTLLLTEEDRRRHYDDIKRSLDAHTDAINESTWRQTQKPQTPRYHTAGTQTEIIPCPRCREPKRVGPETKRFRCKKCGIDMPYPFST